MSTESELIYCCANDAPFNECCNASDVSVHVNGEHACASRHCLYLLKSDVVMRFTPKGEKWSQTHTLIICLLSDAGKSVLQRSMCQHMWCADMESYRNRMNQREVEEERMKEERSLWRRRRVSRKALSFFHCSYIIFSWKPKPRYSIQWLSTFVTAPVVSFPLFSPLMF